MAEPVTSTPAPAVPPPIPASAIPAAKAPSDNKFMEGMKKFLTTTTFLALGIGLLVISIFLRFHPGIIPAAVKPMFDQFIPHMPYFIAGWGLFFLGTARSMAAREYTVERRKNRNFPHAWKIPLVAAQAFILQASCFFYAIPVGLGWVKPVHHLMGLLFLFFAFGIYLLWYVIAHFQNRFPSVVGLRVAMLALVIAAVTFLSWTLLETVFLSLMIGLFAVITAFVSLGFSQSRSVEQRGGWLQFLCLLATMVLLFPVALKAIPFGNNPTTLVGLGLAAEGISGTVESISYSLDGKKVAFTEKTGEERFLQILNPENENLPMFKVSAGDGETRPIFVQGGTALLLDQESSGGKGLWKVNAMTGSESILRRQGVQAFMDGVPWSEKTGQFLYVAQTESGYQLNALDLVKNHSMVLMTSSNPIYSPSWANGDQDICYADGTHGLFYLFNMKSKTKNMLMSDLERTQGEKFITEGKVQEVIPAPDGFRYLYVVQNGEKSSIWVVRTDGTHRDKLYETESEIKDLSWFPDGQKILFEEKRGRLAYLFITKPSCVKILDANLGTVEDLIPPQISNESPAVSPDGVKVAFAASEGLWYPSMSQGLWVALLR